MRGPESWRKRNVNRVWECPACQRRERTGGHIVNRRCVCSAAAWMCLVEEKKGPATLPEISAAETEPRPVGAPAGEAESGSAAPRVEN
jgi:hypothetical protein